MYSSEAMKYFICAMDSILLGIPAERTERIIPADEAGDSISLSALLRLKDQAAPHGLVLKGAQGSPSAPDAPDAQAVLLTPRIEDELEIPDEDIHRLPETLAEMLPCFRGAHFTDRSVILILDPEKLLEGNND